MVVVTWWAFWYWACLIMSVEHHPHWVRFEFQFSVFRPARQQPMISRGGQKIQVRFRSFEMKGQFSKVLV
ncbi:unnamed protein product [Sphagnum troendelagicum]|uniref:Secreted protein n=1 Tax=Sphagnum troendelagicum TaxID=128251 RepID=A0ABP0UHP9_9BRYO